MSSTTSASNTDSVTASNSSSTASVILTKPAASATPEPENETVVISDKPSTLNLKCDQCDYTNVGEKGLRQHRRMKHRLSQVDGIHDSEEEIMEDIVTLEMQDNGLAKIKISASNETPPEKVLHPKLGVGTQPTYTKFEDKNCIQYNFEKGKFMIEVFEK